MVSNISKQSYHSETSKLVFQTVTYINLRPTRFYWAYCFWNETILHTSCPGKIRVDLTTDSSEYCTVNLLNARIQQTSSLLLESSPLHYANCTVCHAVVCHTSLEIHHRISSMSTVPYLSVSYVMYCTVFHIPCDSYVHSKISSADPCLAVSNKRYGLHWFGIRRLYRCIKCVFKKQGRKSYSGKSSWYLHCTISSPSLLTNLYKSLM
jgi:hypothetical protein